MTDSSRLKEALQSRILVIDGAMGTTLQKMGLTTVDYGGEGFFGCPEHLNLTRPDIIAGIHESYLQAGADIIQTNTFNSTSLDLAQYPPLESKAYQITLAGAKIARQTADRYQSKYKPRFVAGTMGPTNRLLSIMSESSFLQLAQEYKMQAKALVDGGVDYLLLETCQDTLNIKAGVAGIYSLWEELGYSLPVAVSVTVDATGNMLAGQDLSALVNALEHLDLLYLGLNCSMGPEELGKHIMNLAEVSVFPIAFVPNAGIPNAQGEYPSSRIAEVAEELIEKGLINLIGGCCGTTDKDIAQLAKVSQAARPRPFKFRQSLGVSGLELVNLNDLPKPVLIGERANVVGSRAFKELILQDQFHQAGDILKEQVKDGAQIVDVCLANPERDEVKDLDRFLFLTSTKVKVPFMIDSVDTQAVKTALRRLQGKSIINSVNFEDGGKRMKELAELARLYGAALVVGTIDEDKTEGMALTKERKLQIALRAQEYLSGLGFNQEDIIIDPLVFPCATGDEKYLKAAKETIEGIRLIKKHLPRCKCILGVSNVSFGLPPAARDVLNSVFLHHCVLAGLDLAIVNVARLRRYHDLEAQIRLLTEDMLFSPSPDKLKNFIDVFRDKPEYNVALEKKETADLDERIINHIVEGSIKGFKEDLLEKLKETAPLQIINGPLMQGIDRVGKLFYENKLIVAEVLQSAESMRYAIDVLKEFMDKQDVPSKGKMVLATVKDDVHDIGKNLVSIILSNNGFDVIDLGIKVPSEDIIKAVKQHQPDMIGLSALLIRSTQQMAYALQDLSQLGIDIPVIVGGAALSKEFVDKKLQEAYIGPVYYAKDAMQGLKWANEIINRRGENKYIGRSTLPKINFSEPIETPIGPVNSSRNDKVKILSVTPKPMSYQRQTLKTIDLKEVWGYLNWNRFYSRHFGLQPEERVTKKGLRLEKTVDEVKAMALAGEMHLSAVWQFFRANSDGNCIHLYHPQENRILHTFVFPRQAKKGGLCIADYVKPLSANQNTPTDSVCLMAVTSGVGIQQKQQEYKEQGQYLISHTLGALAVDTVEALGTWLHRRVLIEWGLSRVFDSSKGYQGARYSFGMPSCPDLELQKGLFKLLEPEEIGIRLTPSCMMEPEASLTALIVHHPQARYFTV
jgi:5-methyltetrahydrofolate--homocysteine methyltransferase